MAKTKLQIRGAADGQEITLPTWTDPTSVAAFGTAIVSAVNGVLALTHTGYQLPPVVEAIVAPVSFLVAGGALIANIIRHAKATVAAIAR